MSQHDPTAYGAGVGGDYDALYPESHDPLQTDATVACVAGLASGSERPLFIEEDGRWLVYRCCA